MNYVSGMSVVETNGKSVLEEVGNCDILQILLELRRYAGDERKKMAFKVAFNALEAGRSDVIDVLIDEIDVNDVNNKKQTLLHLAANQGQLEIVQMLLDRGANVHVYDVYGHAPIHLARYPDIVDALIAHNCDINLKEKNSKRTLLHYAVMAGNEDVVAHLIQRGANLDVLDEDNCTPLYHAVKYHRVQILHSLIEAGATVDIPDLLEMTPLMLAIKNDHMDLAEILLQAGADVNACDLEMYTPIHFAVKHNRLDWLKLLVNYGADLHAKAFCNACVLHTWAQRAPYANREVLDFLLEAGFDINVQDQLKQTPLHYAAFRNELDMMELLIQRGANVNLQCDNGYTALYWAKIHENQCAVELLLAHGADPNVGKQVTTEQMM